MFIPIPFPPGLAELMLPGGKGIGLLPPIGRNASGVRLYNDKDIARVQFVQRAQKMNFSLAEIGT